MTIVCSECGHQNEDDSDFCSSCGEPLEWTGVRVGEEEPEPAPTVVVPPPAPEPPAAPAPAPEVPPAPAADPPAADVPAAPAEPPKPKKIPRIGRKEKEAAAVVPPPPPAAPPAPPARPATPPPAPSAPKLPAPAAEAPPAPAEPETPPAPPGPAAKTPAPPAAPKGPTARPPAPRAKTPPPPPVEDAEEEAARLAAEAEEQRRAELSRKLVVPVERPPEPVPVVAAPVDAPVVVKLTWWQRLVRWFKRVVLRQKPAAAAAVATPVVGTAAAPEAAPTGTPAVGARAPAAQKPREEIQRRTPKSVQEEAPLIAPGDLICTQCGTGNSPTNKFCKRCGHSLAEAPVAKKPRWWKRFFGFFRFRKKRKFAAGERKKKQLEGGKQKKSIFWMFQGGMFKIVGLVTVAVIALAVLRNWQGPLTDRFWTNYHGVHDIFLPGFKEVNAVSSTASSHLNRKHNAPQAVDGITNTSWISKPTKRSGVLQTITINFGEPIRVGKIGILNGDQTTEKTYVKQARLHVGVVFFFDKKGKRLVNTAKRCTFDDKPEFQTCGVDVKGVKSYKIRAISIYPSQQGKSLALSEVETRKKT